MIFRREGTGGILGSVKAGTMKVERWAMITAARRIASNMLECGGVAQK